MFSSDNTRNALVIGSSSGIATALVSALLDDRSIDHIHTVSRQSSPINDNRQTHHQIDSGNEDEVASLVKSFRNKTSFSLIVCCIGTLHGGEEDKQFQPEKRLESLNAEAMLRYFQTNTLAPMNWLKQIVHLVPKDQISHVVFFTARVASIEDNRLGGWYGYRASKAALNMLLKTAQVELSRRSPKAVLVSYHPGTVDTALSKPFQKNVPEGKLFTPALTVSQLLKILPTLELQNTPHYIDWQGKAIPW
jgi:NAD(P)-dependent dehydrogenase (short-subunit alcohol dehydrogenase family)